MSNRTHFFDRLKGSIVFGILMLSANLYLRLKGNALGYPMRNIEIHDKYRLYVKIAAPICGRCMMPRSKACGADFISLPPEERYPQGEVATPVRKSLVFDDNGCTITEAELRPTRKSRPNCF